LRQTFAPDEKIGSHENCLRQTFAPAQNLGEFRKLFAGNLCALQNNKKLGGWSK
jgi:hypothetical protein